MKKYLTAESVSPGHPDKLTDYIADSILDAILKEDPNARVAIDGVFKDKYLTLGGEITTTATVNYEEVIKNSLRNVGYTQLAEDVDITLHIFEQSPDIALGTNDDVGGAGDQGTITGYAISSTPNNMPIEKLVADEILRKLYYDVRPNYDYIKPDMKSQVTLVQDGRAYKAHTVVVAVQHSKDCDLSYLKTTVTNTVIEVLTSYNLYNTKVNIIINGTGEFTIGGPEADSGEVGRKIVVDAYGVQIPVGGGAFSGKDPSKVDRSAAYYARYVAKNLVHAGLAVECLITLSYCIGLSKPISVEYDFKGTEKYPKDFILEVMGHVTDFSPKSMIETLRLKRPIYATSGLIGHFGHTSKLNLDYKTWVPVPWESLNLSPKIIETVNLLTKGGK